MVSYGVGLEVKAGSSRASAILVESSSVSFRLIIFSSSYRARLPCNITALFYKFWCAATIRWTSSWQRTLPVSFFFNLLKGFHPIMGFNWLEDTSSAYMNLNQKAFLLIAWLCPFSAACPLWCSSCPRSFAWCWKWKVNSKLSPHPRLPTENKKPQLKYEKNHTKYRHSWHRTHLVTRRLCLQQRRMLCR